MNSSYDSRHPDLGWQAAKPLSEPRIWKLWRWLGVGDFKRNWQPVEPREGMVTVYNSNGQYLGCMGEETWRRLLSADALVEPKGISLQGSEGRGNQEHLSSAQAAVPPGPEAVGLPSWLRVTAGKLGWNQAERNNLTRSADALEAFAARLHALEAENERLREALREACTAYAECANPSLHPDDKEAAWHDLGDVLKAAAWCEGMAK